MDVLAMLRQAAVAMVVVGTAVSLTTAARRWLDHGLLRSGGVRGHPHHCFLCDGWWSHPAECAEGPARLCPWCLAGSRPDAAALPDRILSLIRDIGPARRGRHAHHCPACLTTWAHRRGDACTAGDRAALSECPGCRQRPAARAVS
jgi:hypothetical protein